MLLLTGTPMYNDSQEIIFLLNVLRSNDGLSAIKRSEIFDKSGEILLGDGGEEVGKNNLTHKANGYVSFVRGENPYIFPFKIYPNDYKSPSSVFNFDYPTNQYNGVVISQGIRFLDLYISRMSDFQKDGYKYFTKKMYKPITIEKDNDDTEEAASSGYKEFQEAIYSLNICYPGINGEYLNGKNGLHSVVSRDENLKYRYINPDNNFFHYEIIGNYSAKIKEILNKIINSDGIVLIYSQYKDSGLVPLALALEELGMNRINSSDNLFSNSKKKTKESILQGKYSMITGDVNYSKNNAKEIKVINKEKNKDGSLCKVVLITQAGSEGIDFKNLRQVHILEPWYNLNRMDQIVGRAIRNCSHKDLPLSKRNCQIFMHGSYIDNNEEMIDLYLYRRCEDKARKIGNIQSILKSISVDCLVHEDQKSFSNLKEKLAKIEISTKEVINNFPVKDKPYSLVCDYQENCHYKCINESINATDEEDKTTYSYAHTVKNQLIEQIKRLFLKKHVYTFEEILDFFEMSKNSPEKIYSALTRLVNHKTEIVSDKFGKQGTIINVKNLYVFHPLEFDDSYTTLYDKMRPLKHKPSKIMVTETAPNIIGEQSALINKSLGVSNMISNTSTLSSNRLLTLMEKNFETGMKINGTLKEKHKDFYMNYSLVVEELNKLLLNNEISTTSKRNWLVAHLVESIPFKKELALVNYLFQEADEEKSQFANLVKSYYKSNLIFSFLKGKLLFLIDLSDKNAEIGDKVHIYDSHIKLYYKPNDESKFRLLMQSEKQKGQIRIIRILQKIKVDQKKVSKYLTFVGHYEKDKKEPIQLKVKRVDNAQKSKKNKGRVFKNEVPKDMFPVLNDIIGKNLIVPKMFIKEQLTVVLELISRHFTNEDKIIYINKLQSAENNIEEM